METFDTELINYDTAVVFSADEQAQEAHSVMIAVLDPEEIAFELGAWLIGLSAFARTCTDTFAAEAGQSPAVSDRSREFRILHAALLNCSKLAFRLRKSFREGEDVSTILQGSSLTVRDIDDLGAEIRSLIILNESISASANQSFGEWRAWNGAIDRQLTKSPAAKRLRSFVLCEGKRGIPSQLAELLETAPASFADRTDIGDLLPSVGTILHCLEIIGRQLRDDRPLKPMLVIFAAIFEQTQHLLAHVNNRLARYPDETAAFYNSLDSASYGATIDLKKVFQQELKGVVRVLPPPSVHARFETAYSLLLDSFQQLLLELARIIKPDATVFDYFPRFQLKLEQSMMLREHIWRILKIVQAAEQAPEMPVIKDLRAELTSFLGSTIAYLHFKDGETFERFHEEVHAARDKKDLVPILNRFGTYLETLFGQISMRAVLAGHPFEEPTSL